MSEKVKMERVSIPVGSRGQTSGILALPEESEKKVAVIVAHGAGNDMNTPLLETFAEGLAREGYPVMRFNFLYSEGGRKSPDRQETLMETWLGAYTFFKEAMGSHVNTYVAAGKSMGGRVASQMTAEKLLSVDGLIFLGYPLHPADNKEKLRDTHLYRINLPMLFFAGTRDPLCDLERLEPVLSRLRSQWELYTIPGGDHSFHVPKSSGTTDRNVYDRIVGKSIDWLSHLEGRPDAAPKGYPVGHDVSCEEREKP